MATLSHVNRIDAAPRGRKRAGEIVIVDAPRKPPPAPKTLKGRRERELWKELYSDPVAVLWTDSDRRLVLRFVAMLARIEAQGADCPGWVFAMAQGIEDRLALSLRSRRSAGIVLEAEPDGTVVPLRGRSRSPLNAALRKQLAADRRGALAGVEAWPQ